MKKVNGKSTLKKIRRFWKKCKYGIATLTFAIILVVLIFLLSVILPFIVSWFYSKLPLWFPNILSYSFTDSFNLSDYLNYAGSAFTGFIAVIISLWALRISIKAEERNRLNDMVTLDTARALMRIYIERARVGKKLSVKLRDFENYTQQLVKHKILRKKYAKILKDIYNNPASVSQDKYDTLLTNL